MSLLKSWPLAPILKVTFRSLLKAGTPRGMGTAYLPPAKSKDFFLVTFRVNSVPGTNPPNESGKGDAFSEKAEGAIATTRSSMLRIVFIFTDPGRGLLVF